MILIVLIERIHAVDINQHRIITEFICIVATIHECRFDCVISKNGRICRNFFEVYFPEISVILVFFITFRCLVMVNNIVVSDDGQDRNVRECLNYSLNRLLHSVQHEIPIVCW